MPMSAQAVDTAVPDLKIGEFFAGIGLVAEALEPVGFSVAWANDIERQKHAMYVANRPSGGQHFHLGDVRGVSGPSLPRDLALATASFPCVDLSLAGNRGGLNGTEQSGMFWEFARVIEELADHKPPAVMLENVHGFASSRKGADLVAALTELNRLGYSCDVFALDGRHWVPQSRPRMFIVGLLNPGDAPRNPQPSPTDSRPKWVLDVYQANPQLRLHARVLPDLPVGPSDLSGIVQNMDSEDVRWWDADRTARFLESLSPLQEARLTALREDQRTQWRTAYRRTRNGVSVWELRRDAIAGCLRTTGGGSSKQALVEVGRDEVRVRWMTPLEYARLMGAGEYNLRAGTANQALFGFGDAVIVDVIRWIGAHYLRPVLAPVRSDGALPSAATG